MKRRGLRPAFHKTLLSPRTKPKYTQLRTTLKHQRNSYSVERSKTVPRAPLQRTQRLSFAHQKPDLFTNSTRVDRRQRTPPSAASLRRHTHEGFKGVSLTAVSKLRVGVSKGLKLETHSQIPKSLAQNKGKNRLWFSRRFRATTLSERA